MHTTVHTHMQERNSNEYFNYYCHYYESSISGNHFKTKLYGNFVRHNANFILSWTAPTTKIDGTTKRRTFNQRPILQWLAYAKRVEYKTLV